MSKSTKTYEDMYVDAAAITKGYYKGYTDGNALSLYVEEKYNINAAANSKAHNALCEVLKRMKEIEENQE